MVEFYQIKSNFWQKVSAMNSRYGVGRRSISRKYEDEKEMAMFYQKHEIELRKGDGFGGESSLFPIVGDSVFVYNKK